MASMMTQVIFLTLTGLLVTVTSSSFLTKVDTHQNELHADHRISSVWRSQMPNKQEMTLNRTSSHVSTYRQCQKLACPPSQLVEDRGSYKIVFFPSSPYAKTRLAGQTLVPATLGMYTRLRNYITGNNVNKQVIPMTAPVILRVDPNGADAMWSPKNFTLFFYIDPSVESPPAPVDTDISVVQVNSYTLFIRTFSGFPVTFGDWMRELLMLAADVEADGEVYNQNFFYFASYDPPTQTTGRINEVQLLKPNKP